MICHINIDKLRKFNKREVIEVDDLARHRKLIQSLWNASASLHQYHKKFNMNYYNKLD